MDGIGGRLQHDRQVRAVETGLAGEQRLQRALGGGHLLAPEEDIADVDSGLELRERQLEHHCDAALHVAGAETLDAPVHATAGPVALSGDGVEMAGEQHQRPLAALGGAGEHAGVAGVAHRNAACAQGREHVRRRLLLGVRLRADVDERERARGQSVGKLLRACDGMHLTLTHRAAHSTVAQRWVSIC